MRLDIIRAFIKLYYGANHITDVIRDSHYNVYYILIDNKFVGSINPLEHIDIDYQKSIEKITEDILIHSGEILQ